MLMLSVSLGCDCLPQLYDLHIGLVGEHRRTDDGCYTEDVVCGLRGTYQRKGGHCGFDGDCVGSLVSTNFKCVCRPGWRGALCNTRKWLLIHVARVI